MVGLNSRILVAGGGAGGSYNYEGLDGNGDGNKTNSSGNLGVGQNGYNDTSGSGGGGGGYYGGKSLQSGGNQGYGGTYYVSERFTNTIVTAGNNEVDGNGRAKITYLGENKTKDVEYCTNGNCTWEKAGYYSYTADKTGYYKLEVWGAQGGLGNRSGTMISGGKGGYTSGEIYLRSGETIYAYVGGR